MMLLLLGLVFLVQTSAAVLVHVHVMYRHGDRAPVEIYPTDPHQGNAWPSGLGELTKLGKMQHFALGNFIRQRYGNFLQETFNATEFYVRSTDVDRTLMSAECNLAGLFFPNSSKDQFNQILKWNPIPIHTIPVSLDSILYGGQDCPRVAQLMQQVHQRADVRAVEAKNKEFFAYLQMRSGMSINLTTVWAIVDTTLCEMSNNLSIPVWITPTIFKRMKVLDLYEWNLGFSTLALRQLRGGAILYTVLEHLEALSRYPKPAVFKRGSKMIMYSGHDFTISDFMNSAHINNGLQPPYASAVFVELHYEDNQYVVKFFLRNSTMEPYQLTVDGCTQACPVGQLVKLLSEEVFHPNEYRAACKPHSQPNLKRDLSFAFSGLFMVGVLFILFIIFLYIVKRTRFRRYQLMNNIQGDETDIKNSNI